MSKIIRMFYVVVACVAFSISSTIYAGRVTTSTPLEINGAEHFPTPTRYDRPGDPEVQLAIAFNGVRAEGYTSGLITAPMEEMDDSIALSLPEHDSDILTEIAMHVEAACVGSGRNIKLKPGMALTCDKGDGLHINLFSPHSPHKGIFTLIETRDVEDEVAKEKVPVQKNVTASTANRQGMSVGTLPNSKILGSTKTNHHDCVVQ